MATLPASMRVPNKLTAETLVNIDRGEDLHRAADAQALFKKLGF